MTNELFLHVHQCDWALFSWVDCAFFRAFICSYQCDANIKGTQARPQGRATGAPAQGPQKCGAPKLNYVLTTSAISQKKTTSASTLQP